MRAKDLAHKKATAVKGPTRMERWIDRCRKLSAWDPCTPTPWTQAKIDATREFKKVKELYAGICTSPGCGGRSLDCFWHFAPKSDPLRWQPHTVGAYQRILRYPDEYDMLCGICALDRHFATLAWVWQDVPPESTSSTPPHLVYSRQLIAAAYPRDHDQLLELVNCGKIKAFVGFTSRVKYKLMSPEMKEVFATCTKNPAFLRLNPLYKNIRTSYRKMVDPDLWSRQQVSTSSTPPRPLSLIEQFYF